MRRFFIVVTPNCPHRKGIKVGSEECTKCDYFRGGIVVNFVDCGHSYLNDEPKNEIAQKENEQQLRKKGRPSKKAISKPVNKRKTKK